MSRSRLDNVPRSLRMSSRFRAASRTEFAYDPASVAMSERDILGAAGSASRVFGRSNRSSVSWLRIRSRSRTSTRFFLFPQRAHAIDPFGHHVEEEPVARL